MADELQKNFQICLNRLQPVQCSDMSITERVTPEKIISLLNSYIGFNSIISQQ